MVVAARASSPPRSAARRRSGALNVQGRKELQFLNGFQHFIDVVFDSDLAPFMDKFAF